MSTQPAISARPTPPMTLLDIQREMAAAVMHPLSAEEGMQSQSADGRPMTDVAASFIAPNSQLTPFERLEIYNQQYWFRVLDCLADDYPALRAVLGSRIFEAISIGYLTDHPSRSFSMRNLGSKLPAWLAAHPKIAGRRHRLALDVARIEWAFVEAFDNAEHTPLTPTQIAELTGESLLGLQPHLRLLSLAYAADELVLGLHDQQRRERSEAGREHDEDSSDDANSIPPARLPRLRPRPTWVAAHRVDNVVYYCRLDREEFRTLSALRQGVPLGEALEAGFQDSSMPEPRRPRRVQAWFAHWAELGWVCTPGQLEPLPGQGTSD